MEITTGIQLGRKAALIFEGLGNTTREMPLVELGTRGLPTSRANKLICTLNFRQFESGFFAEYAHQFELPSAASAAHTTWSVAQHGTRFVIPALALIRAIAQPHKLLIAKLFKPQTLDEICIYRGATDNFLASPTKFLTSHRVSTTKAMLAQLSWLYCFPSARQAWASVYQSAKSGALHVKLPEASVTLQLSGVRAASTLYVTQLSILNIEPHEHPFDFALGHPPRLSTSEGYQRGPAQATYQKLTQEEWQQIVRTLDAIAWKRRPGDYDRTVVDCMLERTLSNSTWRSACERNSVGIGSAAKTLQRWQADGRLDRVVDCLQRMRSSDSVFANALPLTNAKTGLDREYVKVTDIEWETLKPLLGKSFSRGFPSIDNRSIVNCLWERHTSRMTLPSAARSYGVPIARLQSTLERWKADGRYERLIAFLQNAVDEVHPDKTSTSKKGAGPSAHHLITPALFYEIAPLLTTNPHAPPPDADNRSILDCALQKLSLGVTWEAAAHTNGLELNRVKRVLRGWNSDGRLNRVREALLEMRTDGSETPAKAGPS